MTIATRATRTILALGMLSACGGPPPERETAGAPPPSAPSTPPSPTGAAVPPPPELAGAWLLQSIDGQPVLKDLGSTLMVRRRDGTIVGYGGCNGYMAPLTVSGDRLTVGAFERTRRTCPDPAMEQEGRFVNALTKAERFAIAGATLHVYVAGHERPLEFTRMGESKPPAP